MDRFLNFPNLPTSLTAGAANINASSITVVGMSSNQPVRTGAGAFLTTGDIAISEVTGLQLALDSKIGADGFPDTSELNVTFSEATPDRTVTLTPTATNFKVYIGGVTYTKTTETFQISTDIGVHMVYYNSSGVLAETVNPSDAQRFTLLETYALVCVINWNNVGATGFKEIFFSGNNLLHGVQMDNNTQAYLYSHFGIRWILGGLLGDFSEDGDGSLDDHARFSITATDLLDQDIYLSLDAILETAGMPIYHIISGAFFKQTNAGFSVATTGTGRLAYNPNWTSVAEVTDGYYVYYHIYATSNSSNVYYAVMSRYQYDTLATAQDAGPTEVCELNQTFPLFELTPIGSVLYQTDSTYTNAVKARVVSISATEIFHDTRRVKISQQVICLKHSQIAGLNDDDHKIYALKSGRSGDELNIDQINEFTLNEGTTFPDGIKVDTIGESTTDNGVSIETISLKDGDIIYTTGMNIKEGATSIIEFASNTASFPIILKVNTISEYTTNNGVTIDSLILKDNALYPSPLQTDSFLKATTIPTTDIELQARNVLKLICNGVNSSGKTVDFYDYTTLIGQLAGTTNTSLKLVAPGSGNAYLILQKETSAGDSYIQFNNSTTAKWKLLSTGISDNFQLYNENLSTHSMQIADDGRTWFPQAKDDIVGGSTPVYWDIITGQIGKQSSNKASKTNIKPIADASFIYELKPKTFNYRKLLGRHKWSETEFNKKKNYGLLAEDMEVANKDFCHYTNIKEHISNCPDKDKNMSYECKCKCAVKKKLSGVAYHALITPVIACIQEQKKEIDDLKKTTSSGGGETLVGINRDETLKKEIDELKDTLNTQGQRMALIEKRLADLERI